jgi:hypothetical protein
MPMDIYTLVDNNEYARLLCTASDGTADAGTISVSTLAEASADNTDRVQIIGLSWMVQQGDSIALAWDDGIGAAGTTFTTLVGKSNGTESFLGPTMTYDNIEGTGDAATASDLWIDPTGNEYTLIIHLKKIAGFGGWPSAHSDTEPMGVKTLT